MFGSAIPKCSGHERPFWLTVALAVMLLVSVSITVAQAANPLRLASDLKRDLGALRAQLELIDPAAGEESRAAVAFNADLGDGGPAFQRHSMVTMVATANRRLERLIESHRQGGNDLRAEAVAGLRLTMQDLRQQVDRLARTTDPAETTALREAIAAALDRSERDLSALLADGMQPTAAAAALVGDLGPDTVAHSLFLRLTRLHPEAGEVVDAVAVFGSAAEVKLDDFRRAGANEKQRGDVGATREQLPHHAIEFVVGVRETREIAFTQDGSGKSRLGEDHDTSGRLHEVRAGARAHHEEERVLHLALPLVIAAHEPRRLPS